MQVWHKIFSYQVGVYLFIYLFISPLCLSLSLSLCLSLYLLSLSNLRSIFAIPLYPICRQYSLSLPLPFLLSNLLFIFLYLSISLLIIYSFSLSLFLSICQNFPLSHIIQENSSNIRGRYWNISFPSP